MHEAQIYKMSLEISSRPAPGNTGSMRSLQETRSEISHSSHKTEKPEARLLKDRAWSLIYLRKNEYMTHLNLVNLSFVDTISSKEKRHELALVK